MYKVGSPEAHTGVINHFNYEQLNNQKLSNTFYRAIIVQMVPNGYINGIIVSNGFYLKKQQPWVMWDTIGFINMFVRLCTYFWFRI